MDDGSTLERGLLAVERRDWHRARFHLAGQEGLERSVPGLAGLSLACWWLDDGPGFVAAREDLFRLHQQGSDLLAAARVAVRLSWDVTIVGDEDALAWAWLDRARALFVQGDGSPLDRAFCRTRAEAVATATTQGWLPTPAPVR